jgi:hypothetical protein
LKMLLQLLIVNQVNRLPLRLANRKSAAVVGAEAVADRLSLRHTCQPLRRRNKCGNGSKMLPLLSTVNQVNPSHLKRKEMQVEAEAEAVVEVEVGHRSRLHTCQPQKKRNKCENGSNRPKLPFPPITPVLQLYKDHLPKPKGRFRHPLIPMLLLHHYLLDHLLNISRYSALLLRMKVREHLGIGMRGLELLGQDQDQVRVVGVDKVCRAVCRGVVVDSCKYFLYYNIACRLILSLDDNAIMFLLINIHALFQ